MVEKKKDQVTPSMIPNPEIFDHIDDEPIGVSTESMTVLLHDYKYEQIQALQSAQEFALKALLNVAGDKERDSEKAVSFYRESQVWYQAYTKLLAKVKVHA